MRIPAHKKISSPMKCSEQEPESWTVRRENGAEIHLSPAVVILHSHRNILESGGRVREEWEKKADCLNISIDRGTKSVVHLSPVYESTPQFHERSVNVFWYCLLIIFSPLTRYLCQLFWKLYPILRESYLQHRDATSLEQSKHRAPKKVHFLPDSPWLDS